MRLCHRVRLGDLATVTLKINNQQDLKNKQSTGDLKNKQSTHTACCQQYSKYVNSLLTIKRYIHNYTKTRQEEMVHVKWVRV